MAIDLKEILFLYEQFEEDTLEFKGRLCQKYEHEKTLESKKLLIKILKDELLKLSYVSEIFSHLEEKEQAIFDEMRKQKFYKNYFELFKYELNEISYFIQRKRNLINYQLRLLNSTQPCEHEFAASISKRESLLNQSFMDEINQGLGDLADIFKENLKPSITIVDIRKIEQEAQKVNTPIKKSLAVMILISAYAKTIEHKYCGKDC